MNKTQNELVTMIIDNYHGIAANFSDGNDVGSIINQAVHDLLGTDKITLKALRKRSKTEDFFEVVSEVLTQTVLQGFNEDPVVQALVETKNLALGDEQAFDVDDDTTVAISELSGGNQVMNRQRLGHGQRLYVPTQVYGAKLYEEFRRMQSGRVDFNKMIDTVQKAYMRDMRQKIWTCFESLFNGVQTPYSASGSYSHKDLLTIMEHVSSGNESDIIVLGSKLALSNIKLDIHGAQAQADMYNMGYLGSVSGVPVMAIQQFHRLTGPENTFGVSSNDIYIAYTGTQKPIKHVSEGEFYTKTSDPYQNADLTTEFQFITSYGIAAVYTGKFGKYSIT